MEVWNSLRRTVTRSPSSPAVPPSPPDAAWDHFFEEVTTAEQAKPSKHVPPRAAAAPKALPRRGWLGRTFVAPVERFLGGLARLVVTVVAIVVGGGVFVAALTKLPFGQSPDLVTTSVSVPDPSSRADSPNSSPAIAPPVPARETSVSALAPENTRQPAVVSQPIAVPAAVAAVVREPVSRTSPPARAPFKPVSPKPDRPSQPKVTQNKPAPPKAGSSHKESMAEKLYEKATGKEVVHKKDGTTFERKQSKK